MSIRTYFENIASAIKEKNTSIVTVTPSQMPQAILDIETGGGGVTFIEPIHKDVGTGYVNSGTWYYSPGNGSYADVYYLPDDHWYLFMPALPPNYGNRFRIMASPRDPYNYTSNISGLDKYTNDYNVPAAAYRSDGFRNYPYFIIGKTNQNVTGIKTYVVDITDWG